MRPFAGLRGSFAAIAAAAIVLATAMPARTQAVYGSVAGTVTDATGAAMSRMRSQSRWV